MEEIIKLVTSGIDTYGMGQKLYDAKYKQLKNSAIIEISKVSSLLLLGILFISGMLIVVTTLIVSLSRYAIEVIDNPILQYMTPVGLALLFMVAVFFFRKNLYLYFTRKIAVELLT